MNLFNIGVDGQYRVAAFAAAVVAGEAWLPGYLNTAWRSCARWSSARCGPASPACCAPTRGVSEVISTIMLNAIATGLVPTCCARPRCASEGSNGSAPSRSPRAAGSRASRSATVRDGDLRLRRHRRAGRLRATGSCSTGPASASTCAPPAGRDRRRRQRHQRQADDRRRDADLRRASPAWSACRSCSATPTPTARRSSPASASPASRSRCSAATTRSASRSARCCSPSSTSSPTRCRSWSASPPTSWRSPRASIVLTVVIAYEVVRRYGVRLEQRRWPAPRPRPSTDAAEEVPA